jgi:hypothetical protein
MRWRISALFSAGESTAPCSLKGLQFPFWYGAELARSRCSILDKMQSRSAGSSSPRSVTSNRDICRIDRVVVERAPAGRVRNRWVYDDAEAAHRAFAKHVAEAA